MMGSQNNFPHLLFQKFLQKLHSEKILRPFFSMKHGDRLNGFSALSKLSDFNSHIFDFFETGFPSDFRRSVLNIIKASKTALGIFVIIGQPTLKDIFQILIQPLKVSNFIFMLTPLVSLNSKVYVFTLTH